MTNKLQLNGWWEPSAEEDKGFGHFYLGNHNITVALSSVDVFNNLRLFLKLTFIEGQRIGINDVKKVLEHKNEAQS